MFALKGRSLLVCSWISVLAIALLDHFTGYEIGFLCSISSLSASERGREDAGLGLSSL